MRSNLFLLALLLCATPSHALDDKTLGDIQRGLNLLQGAQKVAAASKTLSPHQEKELGRMIALSVFRRYGALVNDPARLTYLSWVGATVAARSNRPATSYRFALIDNDGVNAFAAPGGYIFITTGLLRLCKNEAELAGVIAHEVAHVAAGHMVATIQRSRRLAGLAQVGATLGNANQTQIDRMVATATAILFTHGLDKKMEYEADRLGVAYAALAGYDAGALPDFLARLRGRKGKNASVFFGTHPPLSDRIARIERDALPKYREGGRTNQERFSSLIPYE